MPEVSVSLWPDVIRATVQSPESILLDQAEALTQQTSGVLVGKVGAGPSDDGVVLLHFSMVVPALRDYRHRIMVVQHRKEMHYPAFVDAELFRARGIATLQAAIQELRSAPVLLGGVASEKPANRADSDKEFIELVRQVLRSSYVVSVAQSLIARANETNSRRTIEPLQPDTEPPADAE